MSYRILRSLLPSITRSTTAATPASRFTKPFSSFASTSTSSILLRQATISSRSYATEASNLGNLYPVAGSSHARKRIGRGIGSGRGGTSGRGHKGQGARSGNGKPALHFAGGQTPITRAFPKRGFTNPLRQEMTPLNLDRLQHWIDRGLIDPTVPITMKELFETRCVHGIKHGVKLLADGKENFTTPGVQLTVSKASQSAIAAIEKLEGSVVARYENRLTLRALINPTSFARKGIKIPGKADPIGRKDLVFYGDIKNRGYLALDAGIAIPLELKKPKFVARKEAEIIV